MFVVVSVLELKYSELKFFGFALHSCGFKFFDKVDFDSDTLKFVTVAEVLRKYELFASGSFKFTFSFFKFNFNFFECGSDFDEFKFITDEFDRFIFSDDNTGWFFEFEFEFEFFEFKFNSDELKFFGVGLERFFDEFKLFELTTFEFNVSSFEFKIDL